MRCIAKTRKGVQCSRKAKIDTTCIQHWKVFIKKGLKEILQLKVTK